MAEDGIVEVRDVADGPDARDVRGEALVDEHGAALEIDAGALQIARRRLHADADDRELGLDLHAGARDGAGQPAAAAAELRHGVAEDHVDAPLAVEPLERARELGRLKRRVERVAQVDLRDRQPAAAQRGRRLHADEAAADHERAGGRLGRLAHGLGVVERAVGVHAGERLTGRAEGARQRSGGQHEPVVGHGRPVGQRDGALARIDARHRRSRGGARWRLSAYAASLST